MPRLILIAGGTASGKSTVAANLKNRLKGYSVAVFSHDHYYKDISHLTKIEHDEYNFDHPDAIDASDLINDLKILLTGGSIRIPVYNYATYTRLKDKLTIPAADIVIIEGIFALYYADLTAMADLKIFVDTEPEMRLKRRIDRDTAERCYGRDDVIRRYLKTVKPMHDLYIEPQKNTADIIVNGCDDINHICDQIISSIISLLK